MATYKPSGKRECGRTPFPVPPRDSAPVTLAELYLSGSAESGSAVPAGASAGPRNRVLVSDGDPGGFGSWLLSFLLSPTLKPHGPAISGVSQGRHTARRAEVTTPGIQGASCQAALHCTACFICLLVR